VLKTAYQPKTENKTGSLIQQLVDAYNARYHIVSLMAVSRPINIHKNIFRLLIFWNNSSQKLTDILNSQKI